MAVFFIATSRIKDPAKFADYGSKAAGTFLPFGGELVARGKAYESLAGESDHHAVGVVRFANMEALNSWFRSADYQALISLRDAAADMTLVAYAEPA